MKALAFHFGEPTGKKHEKFALQNAKIIVWVTTTKQRQIREDKNREKEDFASG